MAHKKGLGSSRNGRDSNAQRLGVKVFAGEVVTGHEKGKKIHGLKFKPKRGYKRRYGARAYLTRLEVSSIKAGARKAAAKTAKEKDDDGS